ncbi:MAG: bifunctional glutamate N-acetyltransferase/amino-acid acetyltransferase ArgJ [Cryobacterium sp.]|nr:bifunctional glutamate N-acetyltransferase/amino-acid acetyltransferase ArgJ [Cryobacterium sp.]MBX3116172.1 bifunctional glutamate N-acetyltransferase/amino-acid acetyltransferase ArgJ [Cryobacterium sp.]
MSVTAASGFESAGIACGLKPSGEPDLALVVNRGPRFDAAVVFTSNRSKANPILWSQHAIADGRADAVVLNSGGANCFTGHEGFQTVHATADRAAELLGVSAGDVLVCSTGLIGQKLDRGKILAGLELAVSSLSGAGGEASARAIMTTDSKPKLAVAKGHGWTIGGMAKGAGMLAPALATMLVVLTTDAVLASADLQLALTEAVRLSFNRLDSDGCTSTNDQVSLLASGASGIEPGREEFQTALNQVCLDLAVQLMADAEGAGHEITIRVGSAASEVDAEEVGRSIARNNLFKAAVFGNDPNWGRVLAAIGTTAARFDPYLVDVSMNGVRVCHEGAPDASREEVDLSPRKLLLEIELNSGSASATILTNDLTHAYVHENSAYAS